MKLKQEILAQIAELRAAFNALDALVPYEALASEDVAVHPQSMHLLKNIETALVGTKNIERLLRKFVLAEKKAIMLLSEEDRTFLDEIVRARFPVIKALYIKYHSDGWFEEFFDETGVSQQESAGTDIHSTIDAALRFWDWTVEDEDVRREEDFDFDGALEVVESPYFEPDLWRSNARFLQPVAQRDQDVTVPPEVRRRLEAVYAAFLFGNWFACLAMARATLEFSILFIAKTRNITTRADEVPAQTASLAVLIERTAQAGYTELLEPMERIRKQGNRVMHPLRGGGRVDTRDTALTVVADLKASVEALFAGA